MDHRRFTFALAVLALVAAIFILRGRQPDARQPDVRQPGGWQPDLRETDVRESDLGQPDVREPADVAPEHDALGLSVPVVTSAVEFPVRTTHGEIAGHKAGPRTLASYLPLLKSEWGLYPPSLIRKTGLRRIVVCEGLTFAGQRRTAVPDFEHNDLYLDAGRGRYDELYTRCVIHHEFFHVIDYRDDGELYSDRQWAQLNPAGFRYGSGGKDAQGDASVSLLREDRPGFLNGYSLTGVEEDKAELFANLIVRGKILASRAARDPVLHSKIARMKELLAHFCAEMDEQFWIAAETVQRPADE